MGCGLSTFRVDEDDRVKPIPSRIGQMRIITDHHKHHHDNAATTTPTREDNTFTNDNEMRKSASSYATAANDAWSVRNSMAQEDEIDICDGATKKSGEEGVERGGLVVADGNVVPSKREGHHSFHEFEGGRVVENINARFSDYSDAPTFMRSPSFREYCVVCDSDDDDDGTFDGGEKRENGTQKKEGIPSLNQGSTAQLIKKGRRGRRMKVFPANKSSAVNKILNVTPCYSPSHSSSHNASRKPTEKRA